MSSNVLTRRVDDVEIPTTGIWPAAGVSSVVRPAGRHGLRAFPVLAGWFEIGEDPAAVSLRIDLDDCTLVASTSWVFATGNGRTEWLLEGFAAARRMARSAAVEAEPSRRVQPRHRRLDVVVRHRHDPHDDRPPRPAALEDRRRGARRRAAVHAAGCQQRPARARRECGPRPATASCRSRASGRSPWVPPCACRVADLACCVYAPSA